MTDLPERGPGTLESSAATRRRRCSALGGKNRQVGQGMGEYLLVIGAISLTAVGVMGAYGDTIRHQMAGLAQEISGVDASDMIAGAQSAANRAGELAKEGGAFFGSKVPGTGNGGGGNGPGNPTQPPGGGAPGAGGDPDDGAGGGDEDPEPPSCDVP